jgi:alpha-D-ribose 1-methylphosphonate 5-triphosphate synthase subunit PhnH
LSSPAFADPVFQSQAAFRAILRALSRPGLVLGCGRGLAPPPPLGAAAAAVLLTLADFETSLWLSPAYAESEVGAWLKFHTGSPMAAPGQAAFALVDLARGAFRLDAFAQGTAEYPDRSTTVVAEVAELSDGPLRLTGPGVKGEVRFGFQPWPVDFAAQWRANHAVAPLGVDLILTAGEKIAALPRSTRIAESG